MNNIKVTQALVSLGITEWYLKTEPANVMNHEIKWYVELKK